MNQNHEQLPQDIVAVIKKEADRRFTMLNPERASFVLYALEGARIVLFLNRSTQPAMTEQEIGALFDEQYDSGRPERPYMTRDAFIRVVMAKLGGGENSTENTKA